MPHQLRRASVLVLPLAICLQTALGLGGAEIAPAADVSPVARHVGVYTAPPATVGAPDPGIKGCRVPDGPLLGNGDLAVAVGGTATTQTYYISKADLSQSTRGVGGLTLRFHAAAGDATRYRQEQDLALAEVRSLIPLAGADVRARTWTADDGDLLVTEVSADGDAAIAVDLALWAHAARATIASGSAGDTLWSTREFAVTMDGKPSTTR
ncbi:MAG: hypothetical protein H0X38_02070, partial [Planctomycetes bacterium]|nr:hypothetical protein [Planctomycetota bacterium]